MPWGIWGHKGRNGLIHGFGDRNKKRFNENIMLEFIFKPEYGFQASSTVSCIHKAWR